MPLLPLALAALLAQQPETMSLLHQPLYPPPLARADRARLEDEAARARTDLARDPANADAVVRLARAQRGLGHVGDALETLTRALEGNADTPAIHLERGRGFIIIRKFDLAQREFRKAADALPGAHCDIGFTLYLLADYAQAHAEYGKCPQPGLFGYLAAQRAGVNVADQPTLPQDPLAHAPITFPGSVASKPSQADSSIYRTYVDGVDRLLHNDKTRARELLQPIVEKQRDRWMEPIYIAAEADYARIAVVKHRKKKTESEPLRSPERDLKAWPSVLSGARR
jgi:tetratricopeptide (TPR) repeat protein